MERKVYSLEERNSQHKKYLLSVTVSTIVSVSIGDDLDHHGAVTITNRNPASGQYVQEYDPEDYYDANEDQALYQQMF